MAMDTLILSNNGTGVMLAVTATSSRAALVGTGDSLTVTNPGGSTIYLALGSSTVTALKGPSSCSYPILPFTKEDQLILDVNADWYHAPYVAAICGTGEAGTLIVQRVSR